MSIYAFSPTFFMYLFPSVTHIVIYSTACNRNSVIRRSRCDTHIWARTITRIFYRATNCRCRREIATTKASCRCKPRTIKTICHKKTGIEETITETERFDVQTDRCIKVVHVIRRSTRKLSFRYCKLDNVPDLKIQCRFTRAAFSTKTAFSFQNAEEE